MEDQQQWKLVPVEPTEEMLEAGAMRVAMNAQYVATAEAKAEAVWRDMLAASHSSSLDDGGKPTEAKEVCAEAYQVVGCLLLDLGIFDTPQAEKILDNLSQARMVHKDVLPWESASPSSSVLERARDALMVVNDCSSQEWQQPDGKRMAATDNQGRRFWFITEDTMEFVRSALAEIDRALGGGNG